MVIELLILVFIYIIAIKFFDLLNHRDIEDKEED